MQNMNQSMPHNWPRMSAADVLSRYWNGSVPVDPIAIAYAMGCEVYADPSLQESGMAEGRRIHFNPRDASVRQRFTIAHELGHIALGHTANGTRYRDDFSSAARDWAEIEANGFAAELLMPAEAVRRVVRSGRFASIQAMAQLFNVSGTAMTYRLKNLGIIPG